AHDATVAAVDAADEHRAKALDAVGAGLVARFAAGPVRIDFVVADCTKAHRGADDREVAVVAMRNGNCGQYVVRVVRQQPQHAARRLEVFRLAEQLAGAYDRRVGRDDRQGPQATWIAQRGLRLLPREARDIGVGQFAGKLALV